MLGSIIQLWVVTIIENYFHRSWKSWLSHDHRAARTYLNGIGQRRTQCPQLKPNIWLVSLFDLFYRLISATMNNITGTVVFEADTAPSDNAYCAVSRLSILPRIEIWEQDRRQTSLPRTGPPRRTQPIWTSDTVSRLGDEAYLGRVKVSPLQLLRDLCAVVNPLILSIVCLASV